MNNDSSKSTLLVITTGFLVLFVLFDWQWALWVSLSVGALGIISSWMAQKIEWVWMKLTKILSYIVPNIILTLVYYLFLTTLAIISRLFKKDPLLLSAKHNSYFVTNENKLDKSSFEKIW